MGEQFDLFAWINDMQHTKTSDVEDDMPTIANWSYGVVELDNGDMVLAEIYWDEEDQPLMWCEANMTVDSEEGITGIVKSLENAIKDLTEEPHAIPASVFYTKGD